MNTKQHITLENHTFDLGKVKRLYPAVLVKTGYDEELTEMSLEWIDTVAKEGVEISHYGIFIIMNDTKQKHTFFYNTREDLDNAMADLAQQLS